MSDGLELVRGSDNPFRDAAIPDADTELIKADLAAEIIAVLKRRKLSARAAGKVVAMAHSDIVKIRNARLDGFSIERLVRILNALDRRVHVKIKKAHTKAA